MYQWLKYMGEDICKIIDVTEQMHSLLLQKHYRVLCIERMGKPKDNLVVPLRTNMWAILGNAN